MEAVAELAGRSFAEGSMGPKVRAACRFAEATGRAAAIGRLDDAGLVLSGRAGTTVSATSAPPPWPAPSSA